MLSAPATISTKVTAYFPFIPTHLHPDKDCFSASYVCRHWHRSFLQQAALWSRAFLRKGEVYVKNILKRTRESPLDIIANHNHGPVNTIGTLASGRPLSRAADHGTGSIGQHARFSSLMLSMHYDLTMGTHIPTPMLYIPP